MSVGADTYTVVSAQERKRFEGSYGERVVYDVQLEGHGTVELVQKPETPPPSGQLFGTIEQGQYGPKFKKAQQDRGGFRGRSPEETRAIQRQHSQGMALAYAAIQAQVTGVAPTLPQIKDWTDHFDADIPKATAPSSPQQNGSPPAQRQAPGGGGRKATEAQQRLVKARAHQKGWQDGDLSNLLKARFGVTALQDLPLDDVDKVLEALGDSVPVGGTDVPADMDFGDPGPEGDWPGAAQ